MNGFEETPVVTIGIPTFNRAWSLPRVLGAIVKLEYPKKRIRIVFVDNCSNDGTQQILQDFKVQWERAYEGLVTARIKSNIPQARNICVKNAIGSYIFFLDSDVVPPPNWIIRALKLFESYKRVAIAGIPYPPESFNKITNPSRKDREPNAYSALIISFGCTAIKLRLFDEIGNFNPNWERG